MARKPVIYRGIAQRGDTHGEIEVVMDADGGVTINLATGTGIETRRIEPGDVSPIEPDELGQGFNIQPGREVTGIRLGAHGGTLLVYARSDEHDLPGAELWGGLYAGTTPTTCVGLWTPAQIWAGYFEDDVSITEGGRDVAIARIQNGGLPGTPPILMWPGDVALDPGVDDALRRYVLLTAVRFDGMHVDDPDIVVKVQIDGAETEMYISYVGVTLSGVVEFILDRSLAATLQYVVVILDDDTGAYVIDQTVYEARQPGMLPRELLNFASTPGAEASPAS